MRARAFSTEAMAAHDYALCQRIHRWSDYRAVCALFRVVSRMGDRMIWYTLILCLPLLAGGNGLRVAAVLAIATLGGVLVYKGIKEHFKRLRPFCRHDDITAVAMALDEFSFPSGHTLHATSFTIILLATLPVVGWLFLPFAILTALSRIILGLHYPSDVVAGAGVGAVIALLALQVGQSLAILPLSLG